MQIQIVCLPIEHRILEEERTFAWEHKQSNFFQGVFELFLQFVELDLGFLAVGLCHAIQIILKILLEALVECFLVNTAFHLVVTRICWA